MPDRTLTNAALSAMRPPPDRTICEWADQEAIVTEGPEAGGLYRSERTPYAVEVMEAFTDPEVEQVVNCWASQTGKTAVMKNVMGYYSSDDPSEILVVREVADEARNFSSEKVEPFFRLTPILQNKLAKGEKNAKNKILYRSFPGGFIAFAGAGSIAALSGRSIRIVLFDEVDRYRHNINHGENPILQGMQRAKTYRGRRKFGFWSTPGPEGMSEIWTRYEKSDQRSYHVPCPHCGEPFKMIWEQVRYRDDDGNPDPENAWLECPNCEGRIEERHRHRMVQWGRWVPRFPERKKIRGYQISALYSPWTTFAELAEEWLRVTSNRDNIGIFEFYTLQLGIPAPQQGGSLHIEALEKNRMRYPEGGKLPTGVLLLTAMIDTQNDWLEAEVCGWGIGRERWGVRHTKIPGDTSQKAVWYKLDEFLSRHWETEDGRRLAIRSAVIDAGGGKGRPDEVRKFTGPRTDRGIYAIMGRKGDDRPIVDKPSLSNRFKVPTFYVGTYAAKNAVFSALMLEESGPGYWHWPDDPATGYDVEYFRGLLSERRIPVTHAGKTRLRWVETRKRNEPWDLAQYSFVALGILDPDLDAVSALQKTRHAEKKRASPAHPTPTDTPAPPRPAAPPPPPRHNPHQGRPRGRILSRGIKR